LRELSERASYVGIAKHKGEPRRFSLPPYRGPRGDETLCDTHAGFAPADLGDVKHMMVRGIVAGLVGRTERQGVPTILWTVWDNGWIFEARVTNVGGPEYHGYPVRPLEAIGAQVLQRFADWAQAYGRDAERQAAANCRELYGLAR
jgi:hypothetical protein